MQALAKYAFGLGTLQMVLCTAIFAAAGWPSNGHGPLAFLGLGGESLVTEFLEDVANASHSLVSIRTMVEVRGRGGAWAWRDAEGCWGRGGRGGSEG